MECQGNIGQAIKTINGNIREFGWWLNIYLLTIIILKDYLI